MTVGPSDRPERSPLYERLGGWGCIAIVAELWCDRVMSDPQLSAYFAGVDFTTLRRDQTEFLIHLAGGPGPEPAQPAPSLYTRLPEKKWYGERLLSHLMAALVWANVPRLVIEEVVITIEPLLNLGPAVEGGGEEDS
jgi:hemoglobin